MDTLTRLETLQQILGEPSPQDGRGNDDDGVGDRMLVESLRALVHTFSKINDALTINALSIMQCRLIMHCQYTWAVMYSRPCVELLRINAKRSQQTPISLLHIQAH